MSQFDDDDDFQIPLSLSLPLKKPEKTIQKSSTKLKSTLIISQNPNYLSNSKENVKKSVDVKKLSNSKISVENKRVLSKKVKNSLNPNFTTVKENIVTSGSMLKIPIQNCSEYCLDSINSGDFEFGSRVLDKKYEKNSKSLNFTTLDENVDFYSGEIRVLDENGLNSSEFGTRVLDKKDENLQNPNSDIDNVGIRVLNKKVESLSNPNFSIVEENIDYLFLKQVEEKNYEIPIEINNGSCLDLIKSANNIEFCNEKDNLDSLLFKKFDGSKLIEITSLDSIESEMDIEFGTKVLDKKEKSFYSSDLVDSEIDMEFGNRVLDKSVKRCSSSNSIESRLLKSKENIDLLFPKQVEEKDGLKSKIPVEISSEFRLDSIESAKDIEFGTRIRNKEEKACHSSKLVDSAMDLECGSKVLGKKVKACYLSNSIESRLLKSNVLFGGFSGSGELGESCSNLDVLLKLCDDEENKVDDDCCVFCPLCGADISILPNELREEHTNDCLDNEETTNVLRPNDDTPLPGPGQVVDISLTKPTKLTADVTPVIDWLRGLNLGKYEDIFVQEEIDWDTLQWLTEEDLLAIGITALGPRKKIVHALGELRNGSSKKVETRRNVSANISEDSTTLAANKLITDFFPGSTNPGKKESLSRGGPEVNKSHLDSERKKAVARNTKDRKLRDIPQWCRIPGTPFRVLSRNTKDRKLRDIPQWCRIPGTPFRVDAFKYLRSDCSHWFLTHFHIDHYQGLTRSFSHGKIYCSLITAKLVNMKIGIPWEKLQILPLNQKINVAGVDVTCFDANHCPGAIIILFEPPCGKALLHTGDFRFNEDMTNIPVLQTCRVQTLVLDTTYCDPQYDFPKQEAVIQFVIEAIQAEAFNQRTLFLIGSYTIGKERLFLEVARVLHKRIYVAAAKLRVLECLGLPLEDMQWFTSNEQESHIHIVPMWTLASFKRLKCISNQYARNYSLIVAFSPTGWTFGKGKKKSTGRRWQQGTIVRYEVPYSEHSSFSELKEFVNFISPENIVPSVNNDGLESANAMVSLLTS